MRNQKKDKFQGARMKLLAQALGTHLYMAVAEAWRIYSGIKP